MVDASPWLLVGLGNPGPKYADNRHNVGFKVVELWLDRHGTPGASDWREKFHGRYASASGDFGRAVVLEPLTFMNVSGKSVVAASTFFRVPAPRTIVVHDEVDFEFGRVAIKNGGGHGGHNGVRDIVDQWGANDFLRIRVGVGRPPHGRGEVSGWVLSDFDDADAPFVDELIARAEQAVHAIMTRGVSPAMNEFNQLASKTTETESSG
jgi:PTH1 family peptidyl-tRNA hydrolase